MAIGSWMAQYRWYFVATTASLLAYSFYKTYHAGCVVPRKNKIILWTTAVISISLTLYTILKPYFL